MKTLQEVLEHLGKIKEARRSDNPFGLPPGESPRYLKNQEGKLLEFLQGHICALADHQSGFVVLRDQLGKEDYEKVLAETKKALADLISDAIWMAHGYEMTAEEIFAAIPEK